MAKILKYSYLLLFLLSNLILDAQDSNQVVFELITPYGVMKGRLYNETPKHKENFIKLANEGYYDSLLFHRVINNFMIQGGDPDSKKARPGAVLGNGGPGYKVPAEFVEGIYHKKGALAAARLPDNQNPQKASSGSQFYIVEGEVLDMEKIELFQQKKKQMLQQQKFGELAKDPNYSGMARDCMIASRKRDTATFDSLMVILNPLIEPDSAEYMFSEEAKQLYKTVGGTPHLDGGYTVFGEIFEGMNVVDSISLQQVDRRARPLVDIPFRVRIIESEE